jgi:hypothetical protein
MITAKPTPILVAASLASLAAAGLPAYAGLKQSWPVYINQSARYATGQVGSTRNTSDATSYLRCSVEYLQPIVQSPSTTAEPYWSGGCYARDAGGTYASCFFSGRTAAHQHNAAHVLGIKGDSSVTFFWSSSGECARIAVANGSDLEPKAP